MQATEQQAQAAERFWLRIQAATCRIGQPHPRYLTDKARPGYLVDRGPCEHHPEVKS